MRSIREAVATAFPEMPKSSQRKVRRAIYSFSLRLSDGRELSNVLRDAMKTLQIDATLRTHRQREFRNDLPYSEYVLSSFWRSMYLHMDGISARRAASYYNVNPADLRDCFRLLTRSQYAKLKRMLQSGLLHKGARTEAVTLYKLPKSDVEWALGKIRSTIKNIANRRSKGGIAFLTDHDPAFDAEAELTVEALRLTRHYSHHITGQKLLNFMRSAIPREAQRIREHMMAVQRRAVRAVAQYRCPCCKTEWEHPKNKGVMDIATAVKKKLRPEPQDFAAETYYCEKCTQKKKSLVTLEAIETDRAFHSTLSSLETPLGDGDDAGTLSDVIESESEFDALAMAEHSEFIRNVSEQVAPRDEMVIRLLLEDTEEFSEWLLERKVRSLTDPHVRFGLVCSFLGMDYDSTKARLGTVLGAPRAYIVKVGSESDIVLARTAAKAVLFVAKSYHFKSGQDLQRECGKIRVRKAVDVDLAGIAIKEGQVLPYYA